MAATTRSQSWYSGQPGTLAAGPTANVSVLGAIRSKAVASAAMRRLTETMSTLSDNNSRGTG